MLAKTTKVKKAPAKVVKKSPSIEKKIEKEVVAIGKKTTAFAKKNPWAVAGISAGLGLAVGLLSKKGKPKAKKKK